MNLPLQARPVTRGYSTKAFGGDRVTASDSPACIACHLACSALPGWLQGPCNALCNSKVC